MKYLLHICVTPSSLTKKQCQLHDGVKNGFCDRKREIRYKISRDERGCSWIDHIKNKIISRELNIYAAQDTIYEYI